MKTKYVIRQTATNGQHSYWLGQCQCWTISTPEFNATKYATPGAAKKMLAKHGGELVALEVAMAEHIGK